MTKYQNTEQTVPQNAMKYAREYFKNKHSESEAPSDEVDISGDGPSGLISEECTDVIELTASSGTSREEPHLLVLTTLDEASNVCDYCEKKFSEGKVTVAYADEDVILLCQPVTWLGWNVRDNTVKKYEMAMETFHRLMTVEADGEAVDFDTMRRLFQRWYRICGGDKSPGAAWIGRVVRTVTNSQIRRKPQKRVLQNRKWRGTL